MKQLRADYIIGHKADYITMPNLAYVFRTVKTQECYLKDNKQTNGSDHINTRLKR